jgi:predicted nucleic acid-binding protein
VILVDTPMWSLALRRRSVALNEDERAHVDEWRRLVEAGEIALIGPVRQEVLSGVRDEAAWERLRDAMRPFPDLRLDTETYELAASFFNRCQAAGVAGSAIDLLICAASAQFAAPIYTVDADFRRYAAVLGLDLHVPQNP